MALALDFLGFLVFTVKPSVRHLARKRSPAVFNTNTCTLPMGEQSDQTIHGNNGIGKRKKNFKPHHMHVKRKREKGENTGKQARLQTYGHITPSYRHFSLSALCSVVLTEKMEHFSFSSHFKPPFCSMTNALVLSSSADTAAPFPRTRKAARLSPIAVGLTRRPSSRSTKIFTRMGLVG